MLKLYLCARKQEMKQKNEFLLFGLSFSRGHFLLIIKCNLGKCFSQNTTMIYSYIKMYYKDHVLLAAKKLEEITNHPLKRTKVIYHIPVIAYASLYSNCCLYFLEQSMLLKYCFLHQGEDLIILQANRRPNLLAAQTVRLL